MVRLHYDERDDSVTCYICRKHDALGNFKVKSKKDDAHHDIQNELLSLMSNEVLRSLCNDIRPGYFSQIQRFQSLHYEGEDVLHKSWRLVTQRRITLLLYFEAADMIVSFLEAKFKQKL